MDCGEGACCRGGTPPHFPPPPLAQEVSNSSVSVFMRAAAYYRVTAVTRKYVGLGSGLWRGGVLSGGDSPPFPPPPPTRAGGQQLFRLRFHASRGILSCDSCHKEIRRSWGWIVERGRVVGGGTPPQFLPPPTRAGGQQLFRLRFHASRGILSCDSCHKEIRRPWGRIAEREGLSGGEWDLTPPYLPHSRRRNRG